MYMRSIDTNSILIGFLQRTVSHCHGEIAAAATSETTENSNNVQDFRFKLYSIKVKYE